VEKFTPFFVAVFRPFDAPYDTPGINRIEHSVVGNSMCFEWRRGDHFTSFLMNPHAFRQQRVGFFMEEIMNKNKENEELKRALIDAQNAIEKAIAFFKRTAKENQR
jgi:hypothetical protein